MLCKCCKKEIKGIICDRCDYDNAVYLQGDNDVDTYKNKIIDSMKNFCLHTHICKWDAEQGEMKIQESTMKLVDTAKDCYNKIWWSDPLFSQSISDEEKERVLKMEYSLNGKVLTFTPSIKPIQTKGLMRIGLLIEDDFYLKVLLGTPELYSQTKKIRLKIK